MESRTLKLAICYFGAKDENEKILKFARVCFPDYEVHMFTSIGEDKLRCFWKSAFKRREYELQHKFEFDVVMGVGSDMFKTFAYTKIPDVVEANKIYYTTGHYIRLTHLAAADLSVFFCKSIEFDRLSELMFSVPLTSSVTTNESEQFFYHIKSLIFEAECINYENRSLFIRST